jgi:hypothetical protein
MYEPTPGMRDKARECGQAIWAADEKGKLAHRVRIVTVPEIMSGQVMFAGAIDWRRTPSAPPPPEARGGRRRPRLPDQRERFHVPFKYELPEMLLTHVHRVDVERLAAVKVVDRVLEARGRRGQSFGPHS